MSAPSRVLSGRLVALMVGVVVVSLASAEALLQPAGSDRLDLVIILVAPAVVAVAATPLVSRWVSRRASVAGAVLAVALCSLALGAAASSAASNAMFVSSHDYRLFIVVLLLSSGIALAVGSQLTRPLAHDIRRLEHVAERVAAGDLSVRSGIERHDEVGSTAAALDQMVGALADAARERERLNDARRHLFSGIGHDLRSPLAAMRAAVESLEDGVAPDPARYLGIIATQIATVDALLDQLVEYARLESGHRSAEHELVSLTELADECAEALGPLAGRSGVSIVVHGDGPAVVHAHPSELARVVRNLVDNAIRHSPADGTVAVTITSDRTHVRLQVTDDGDGFPDEFRAHAFDPFTRADVARTPGQGHAGLGLAICAAIVAVHHGEISLGPGHGGDVRVVLPVDPWPDTASHPAGHSASDPRPMPPQEAP